MSGLSCKLPMSRNATDGISLNKTFEEVVLQNLINLLLTIPGERMMIPDFGVGLKKYLFENDVSLLRLEIGGKIRNQVSKYLPFVEIIDLNFTSSQDSPSLPDNFLHLRLRYFIIPLNFTADLDLSVSDNNITIN